MHFCISASSGDTIFSGGEETESCGMQEVDVVSVCVCMYVVSDKSIFAERLSARHIIVTLFSSRLGMRP